MGTNVSAVTSKVTYRLQSPWKLVRGVMTVAVASVFVFSGLTGANAGSQPIELQRVVITSGDTIWGLAEQYAGEADLESWIVEFAKLNQLSSSALEPGQSLLLPAD